MGLQTVSTYLPIYLPTYLPCYLPTYLHTYTYKHVYRLPAYLPACLTGKSNNRPLAVLASLPHGHSDVTDMPT